MMVFIVGIFVGWSVGLMVGVWALSHLATMVEEDSHDRVR